MNLPNRKERRKLAKDMGLLNKSTNNTEVKERAKAIGNLIRLRNLTEQRNKKNN